MYKRILKQLACSVFTIGFVANTFAMGSGLYIGLMAGPATNGASNQQAQVLGPATTPPTTTLATPKSQQFGSRLMMGYMVSEYVGMEGGLTYFSSIDYDTGDVQTCSSTNARVRDFEFMGKGVFPFRQMSVYGKAGVAIAYQATSGAFNPDSKDVCGKSSYITKYVPAYSAGVGYDLTQNWVVDLSANTVSVGGKIGSMTTYALGIAYHFVDVYCGQFLCS